LPGDRLALILAERRADACRHHEARKEGRVMAAISFIDSAQTPRPSVTA
jgi:hypothetical protein